MVRIHIQNSKKIQILAEFKTGCLSLRQLARKYRISPGSISKWKAKEERIRRCAPKMTTHQGPSRIGEEIAQEVVSRLESSQNSAAPVNHTQLAFEVFSQHPQHLLREHEIAGSAAHMTRLYGWCRRVTDKAGFSIRRPTHVSQNAINDVFIYGNFIDTFHATASAYNISPDRIFNMDQTRLDFDVTPLTTLVRRGA